MEFLLQKCYFSFKIIFTLDFGSQVARFIDNDK